MPYLASGSRKNILFCSMQMVYQFSFSISIPSSLMDNLFVCDKRYHLKLVSECFILFLFTAVMYIKCCWACIRVFRFLQLYGRMAAKSKKKLRSRDRLTVLSPFPCSLLPLLICHCFDMTSFLPRGKFVLLSVRSSVIWSCCSHNQQQCQYETAWETSSVCAGFLYPRAFVHICLI